jgi:endonuclease I
MLRFFILIGFMVCSGGLIGQAYNSIYPGLRGEQLRKALLEHYKPAKVLSYRECRDTLYANIDAVNDTVYGIYSGHGMYLPPGEDPSQALYQGGGPDGINCEHVWPRSKGASEGAAKSDLHHLFPSRVAVNQARGNLPFGEIEDRRTTHWFYASFRRNSIPAAYNIAAYSEQDDRYFEPREAVKGDIARAMFYFFCMYREEAGTEGTQFFYEQLSTLCEWHQMDPPDMQEQLRTYKIAYYQQGKPNPFIVDPTLVGRLYCAD